MFLSPVHLTTAYTYRWWKELLWEVRCVIFNLPQCSSPTSADHHHHLPGNSSHMMMLLDNPSIISERSNTIHYDTYIIQIKVKLQLAGYIYKLQECDLKGLSYFVSICRILPALLITSPHTPTHKNTSGGSADLSVSLAPSWACVTLDYSVRVSASVSESSSPPRVVSAALCCNAGHVHHDALR